MSFFKSVTNYKARRKSFHFLRQDSKSILDDTTTTSTEEQEEIVNRSSSRSFDEKEALKLTEKKSAKLRTFSKESKPEENQLERKKKENLIPVFGQKSSSSEDLPVKNVNENETSIDQQRKKLPKNSGSFLSVLHHIFTFEFIVSNEKCLPFFEESLKDGYCTENFDFYKLVNKFKQEGDTQSKRQIAKTMIKNYLLIGSKFELNIKKSEKKEISSEFELLNENPISNSFFDKILNLITNMLTLEEYSKFLTSQYFKDYYYKYGYEIFIAKQEEKWETTNDVVEFLNEIDNVESDISESHSN
eukprot:gene5964-9963_t